MRRLYEYLVGYMEFTFPIEKRAVILGHLLASGIGCREFSVGDGVGRLSLLRRDGKRLSPSLGCAFVREGGLPHQLSLLLARPGILVGCLFGCLLLLFSSLTVWRVEIKGNERVESAIIEDSLAKAGLSVGDFVPGINRDAVKARFLRDNPDISWMGIYQRGTTAIIEVREADAVGDAVLPPRARLNLVAEVDGVIERVRVESGRATVREGETVKAGALLISGIYKTADGLKLGEARGEVLARITRTVSILQPLSVEEKEYEDESIAALWCNFFQKDIKLFDFAGKSGQEYDIIKKEKPFVLPGGLRLPISFTATLHRTYTRKTRPLSEEEAVRAAHGRMEEELASLLSSATVLRKSMEGEWREDGYLLTCRLEYIVDIAVPLAYGRE